MASIFSNQLEEQNTVEMSQDTAVKLFDNGGVLIVLNLPVGSIIGIDMKVYHTGEKFCGLKMIPKGLHFVYYSAVSKDGCVAPRTGFFHFFLPKEILIKKWDEKCEDLNSVDPTEEEKQTIQDNLRNLDGNLGPYPFQILKQWNHLTCNLTETLVKKLQPLSGIISSVTQLVPLSYPPKASKESDSTSTKRSSQSLEDKYLPDMKPVPGTEIRFSEIPKSKYPDGSTATEITMHNMDSTYTLEQLLSLHEKDDDLLGELQMAHICFLVAHVYDAFEHWKKLVQIFCSVDLGLRKHTDLLTTLLTILHYQIKEIPTDFFVDITGNVNFLVSTLKILFENIKCSNVDKNFKNFAEKFKKHIMSTYKWDFEGISDEDLPVVVDLNC